MDNGKTRVEAWAAAPESKSDRTTGTTCTPARPRLSPGELIVSEPSAFLSLASFTAAGPGSDRTNIFCLMNFTSVGGGKGVLKQAKISFRARIGLEENVFPNKNLTTGSPEQAKIPDRSHIELDRTKMICLMNVMGSSGQATNSFRARIGPDKNVLPDWSYGGGSPEA